MTRPTSDPTTESAAEPVTEIVWAALRAVVPDASPDAVDDRADLREELELDSLDLLAFAEQLGKRTGQRIDEDDYHRIRTVAGCVEFLQGRGVRAGSARI